MFKFKKKDRAVIFFIIIVFLMFWFSIVAYKYMYRYIYKSNNIEGFNIRQYYNQRKRNFNKLKNRYFYDGKIKIKKFLKNNNII